MKFTLLLILSLLLTTVSFGQDGPAEYSNLLQSYYTQHDPELVDKTIRFVNTTAQPYQRLEPTLKGFFGALFRQQPAVKTALYARLGEIQRPEFQQLFYAIKNTDLDSLYARAKPSPLLNDMSWSSYFATGNPRYLDLLIRHAGYFGERQDLNLYVTAGSALWSLCSNARQHPAVRAYLATVKNQTVGLALQQEPAYFQQEMTAVIREQRAKGIWDPSTYRMQ
jgi:hypothetical protein